MSANLDRSLDEVISSHRTNRRGFSRRGSGAAKASLVGSRPPRQVAAAIGASPVIVPQAAEKIIVSNLPTDVNEVQVRELFTHMIGPLRDVSLTYDARGVSKGIASVVFVRKGDAARAYEQYHDRLIDGRSPMKIEIVVDPRRTPQPLAARVSAAGPVVAGNGFVQSGPRGGGGLRRAGGRGRGRGRGRGGRRGDDRPTKTAEDLDAEMEDYTQSAPAGGAAST